MHYTTFYLLFSSVVPLKDVFTLKGVPLPPSHHQDAQIYAVLCCTYQINPDFRHATLIHTA